MSISDHISPWPESPARDSLESNIHIWWLHHGTTPPPESCSGCLDQDETEQASRFGPENSRTSFLWRRWLRREVISRYVGIPPCDLRFEGKRFEKPILPELQELQFSTTSRAGVAGIALTLHDPLGLDLETLRDTIDLSGLAKKFFRPDELSYFESAEDKDKANAFARVWTVKEAYLKMKGTGLAGNPRTFQLPNPAAENQWVPMTGDKGTAGFAYPLGTRDQIASCLVTNGHCKTVSQFSLSR